MTAQITVAQADRPGRRIPVSLSALAGIGYAAAWIISLSVGAPNPSVAASGSQVVAAFAGRSGSALAMFTLAEGVAAIALVAVMTAAARAARRSGQARAGLAAAAFGIAAATVSWAQLALGTWLISGLVPDRRTATAGAIYHAIMRMDGAKMFLLAAMALAISQLARRSPILPRWLAPLGALLAAALLALLGRVNSDPSFLLQKQRAQLVPIADALAAEVYAAIGFDHTLALWRHESVSATLRFLDDLLATVPAQFSICERGRTPVA